MKKIILYILVLMTATEVAAQDFILKGSIEYEVKVNSKRMFEDMYKGKGGHMSVIGSDGPEFFTSKKQLLFNNGKTLYRPIVTESYYEGGEGKAIFSDLNSGVAIFKSSGILSNQLFTDSLLHLRWKIDDETRVIAGFKCRKALGVMMDSIYVVAFYCPEIVPQGGPEIFNGLPGMILGMAIPRLYTTWFATKVQLEVDDKLLTAPVPGKKEKMVTLAEARVQYRKDASAFLRDGTHDDEVDLLLKGLGGASFFRRY